MLAPYRQRGCFELVGLREPFRPVLLKLEKGHSGYRSGSCRSDAHTPGRNGECEKAAAPASPSEHGISDRERVAKPEADFAALKATVDGPKKLAVASPDAQ
jgi:hypothetical protein